MEINTIEEKQNPLLNRREVYLLVRNEKTPSRIEIKNKVSALLNSKPELVIVEKVNTEFGKQEMKVDVCIYEEEERLKQVSLQYILKRNTIETTQETEEGEEAKGETDEKKEES